MDQETPQKPEIKPEVNQNVKKRGWLANLLSFLGFGSSAGAGAGGITAVSGAGSGLFGGLLGGGVMATKAGMVALALAGSTVAGGIGFVGYKMFVNPNSSGKAGASGKDQFNSLFASRPKDASPDQSSGSSASGQGGNSSSLEMMAKANQGPMAEGETKPEEAAAADTESKTSDAAADQAQANPTAALNNANAPAAGQAASLHTSGLKSDKKFGQLSSGLAGGSSGANFSTAMKGVPSASNPLLAGGGKVNPASALRQQGRSLQGGRREDYKRDSNSRRQLANLNRMQKGGVGNAGSLTFDGGPGGTTIGAAEGGNIEGSPAGQSGVPDRSVNPTPFSQKDVNEPQSPPTKDVTPWANDVKKAKWFMLGAVVAGLGAILMLQQYLESWVDEYNAGYFTALGEAYLTATEACLMPITGAAVCSTSVCVTAFYEGVAEAQALLASAKAKILALAGKAQAVAATSQAEAVAKKSLLNVTSFGMAMAADLKVGPKAAAAEAEQAAAVAEANAAAQGAAGMLDKANGQLAACCAATDCAGSLGMSPTCYTCESTAASVATALGPLHACMTTAANGAAGTAMTTASGWAETKAGWMRLVAMGLSAVAIGASAKAIDIGSKIQKGKYNQESAGKALVLGGGLLAVTSAWTLLSCGKAAIPKAKAAQAAAQSAELKAETMSSMASFSSMPLLMKVAGGAAVLMSAQAALSKPQQVNCPQKDPECMKHAINYRYPTGVAPSDRAVGELLTEVKYCDATERLSG